MCIHKDERQDYGRWYGRLSRLTKTERLLGESLSNDRYEMSVLRTLMLEGASTFESNEKQRAKWAQETGVPDTGLPIHEYVNLASKTKPTYMFTWKHEAVSDSLPMGTYVSHVIRTPSSRDCVRYISQPSTPCTDFFFNKTAISFDTTTQVIPTHVLPLEHITVKLFATPIVSCFRHYCRNTMTEDIRDSAGKRWFCLPLTMTDTSGRVWEAANGGLQLQDAKERTLEEERMRFDIHE